MSCSYAFNLTVSDGNISISRTLVINIVNRNDDKPQFLKSVLLLKTLVTLYFRKYSYTSFIKVNLFIVLNKSVINGCR